MRTTPRSSRQLPLPARATTELARQLDNLQGSCSPNCRRRKAPDAEARLAGSGPRVSLPIVRLQMGFYPGADDRLQEELDWDCYRLSGLIGGAHASGARRREKDVNDYKAWGSTDAARRPSIRDRPGPQDGRRRNADDMVRAARYDADHGDARRLAEDYPRLVERRIDLIESDPNIRLIEQPEYKRRWNTEPWDSQLERALREWLLGRLESTSTSTAG